MVPYYPTRDIDRKAVTLINALLEYTAEASKMLGENYTFEVDVKDNMITTNSRSAFDALISTLDDLGLDFGTGEPEADGEFFYIDFENSSGSMIGLV